MNYHSLYDTYKKLFWSDLLSNNFDLHLNYLNILPSSGVSKSRSTHFCFKYFYCMMHTRKHVACNLYHSYL